LSFANDDLVSILMRTPQVCALGLLALAAGCPAPRVHVSRALSTIGNSHSPYHGKPAYLAEARPLVAVRSDPQRSNECEQHSLACDQRLRATLAALDGQLLALSTPPHDVELEGLQLSLQQLEPLLAPYSDLMPEQRELKDTIGKLPAQPVGLQLVTRKRLIELSDLMRLQLAAAQ
jgi:hypothetical protein